MKSPKLSFREVQGVTIAEFLDKEVYAVDELTVNEIGKSLFAVVKEKSPVHFLLSFANVTYFSSALLGTLLRLYKRVADNGGTFKLCNLNPTIYQIFAVTKLDQVFAIYENEEKALASY